MTKSERIGMYSDATPGVQQSERSLMSVLDVQVLPHVACATRGPDLQDDVPTLAGCRKVHPGLRRIGFTSYRVDLAPISRLSLATTMNGWRLLPLNDREAHAMRYLHTGTLVP
jgi:hypothetical protein